MLKLALAGAPRLQLETCELRRSGPSYMVDTLGELRLQYRDHALVLILGMDAFLDLPTWHRWEQLLDLAHIAVMLRPGSAKKPPEALRSLLARCHAGEVSRLKGQRRGLIYPMTVSQLDISATTIRNRVGDRRDPCFLLPEPVRDYILAQGLYRRGGDDAAGAKTAIGDCGIRLQRLDHLVLTVADIPTSVAFYREALGMEAMTFGQDRVALRFGPHKINLHQVGREFEPKAQTTIPGSADLCLVTISGVTRVLEHLQALGIAIEQGPVARSGALGPVQSVYFRDPDGNLIELAKYPAPGSSTTL